MVAAKRRKYQGTWGANEIGKISNCWSEMSRGIDEHMKGLGWADDILLFAEAPKVVDTLE